MANMKVIQRDGPGGYKNQIVAPRWNNADEEKFFDAIKVFGLDFTLIHYLVFDVNNA